MRIRPYILSSQSTVDKQNNAVNKEILNILQRTKENEVSLVTYVMCFFSAQDGWVNGG